MPRLASKGMNLRCGTAPHLNIIAEYLVLAH